MIRRQVEALERGSSNFILIVVTEKRLRIRNITSSLEQLRIHINSSPSCVF